jgi:hypothetical protein
MVVPPVEIVLDIDPIKTSTGNVEILSERRVNNANINLGVPTVCDYAVCAGSVLREILS